MTTDKIEIEEVNLRIQLLVNDTLVEESDNRVLWGKLLEHLVTTRIKKENYDNR